MHNFVETNNDKCWKAWYKDPETEEFIKSLQVEQPDCTLSDVSGVDARKALVRNIETLVEELILPKAPKEIGGGRK